MIRLDPGVCLQGEEGASLIFGSKGIQLTRDNTVENLTIRTSIHDTAILNDTGVEDFGTLTLRNVRTVGQILLLADDSVHAGRVVAEDVSIEAADLRGRIERPHGFGVDVMQGAFTLWNRQEDPESSIHATLTRIGAGTEKTPVRGWGVFVSGHGDREGKARGGRVIIDQLTTTEITTNGGILPGTADLISAGVFVVYNVQATEVINEQPVTTFGQNDMVLDNWGDVEKWTAKAAITSHGPSGIGFVNFNYIGTLDVQGPIITTGRGARGFNLYDGVLNEASFDTIATTGDGSIGVQISKPLPKLTIYRDLTTAGNEGSSLVRGVQMQLKAIALSVKRGGKIQHLHVGGQISTSGADVATVEIDDTIEHFSVAGAIRGTGDRSDAIHTRRGCVNLSGVDATALHGSDLVETN